MFSGKTLYSHDVSLSTQVNRWVPANLMIGGNPAMDQETRISSRGSRNTPSQFLLQKWEISTGLSNLARMQTLPSVIVKQ